MLVLANLHAMLCNDLNDVLSSLSAEPLNIRCTENGIIGEKACWISQNVLHKKWQHKHHNQMHFVEIELVILLLIIG